MELENESDKIFELNFHQRINGSDDSSSSSTEEKNKTGMELEKDWIYSQSQE